MGRETTTSKLLKRLLSICPSGSGARGVGSDARYALTAARTAALFRFPMFRVRPGTYCVTESICTVDNALNGSDERICQMMPRLSFHGRFVEPLATSV